MAREDKENRCKRSFERRFGQSIMPLVVKNISKNEMKITDTETGSWAIYDTSLWRIRKVREHDAMAPESNV